MYRTLFDAFGPQHWWPADSPIEIIVGAILTQNTAWTNVQRAIANLRAHGLLDVAALRDVPLNELADRVRPAGTFRVKAQRLKAFIDWLCRQYNGDLDVMFNVEPERLRSELLNVKGIGPETADAVMLYAGKIPVFVVDAYTQRISRRHHLIPAIAAADDATYDRTQRVFEAQLAREANLFGEYHALLVAVGKQFCRPRARCDLCPLRDFAHDPEL